VHSAFAGAALRPRPGADPGSLRTALSRVAPQAVTIVVALLLLRTVGATVDDLVTAIHEQRIASWLANLLVGFGALLLMAAPMLVAIVATSVLGPERGASRAVALASAVVLSAGAGALLRLVHRYLAGWTPDYDEAIEMVAYVWPRYALLGGLLTVVAELYRAEVRSVEAMQQADIDRAALDRELTEARLQVLQAQIEPHFLFNTLANVRRLYDEDATSGRSMLDMLMRYLEVALPTMREGGSTLGRDLHLVDAYLQVQRIRMGRRLDFCIDVPAPLRDHPVPPMMLLTLVENAIKHGLNRSTNGGLVRVTARTERARLLLTVADTGVGFASGSGPGVGLANLRARLAAQFGERAKLVLENNDLGGATATIVLPLAPAASPA
jgi:signal transduction histidine kinase